MDQKTKLFVQTLKAVAANTKHALLARELDIPVWQLRNWLYRDTPSPFVVRALWPVLSSKFHAIKTK